LGERRRRTKSKRRREWKMYCLLNDGDVGVSS